MIRNLKLTILTSIFFILPVCSFATDVLLEGKAAYFHPTSSRFRQIYSGGGIYGLELSVQAHNGFYPWLSADYFSKSGRSIVEGIDMKGNRTRVQFVPIGLGIKYIKRANDIFDFYVSLGATATYLHIKNYLTNTTQIRTKWGPGVTTKVGTLITLYKGLFVDVAVDYRYAKLSFPSPCCAADLRGFSFGGGVGYRF